MAIEPSDFANGHGQMIKINRYFNKFQQFQQQKIWNCRDGHDQA
jgi:hypothetical protein